MAKTFLRKIIVNPLQRMVSDSRSVGIILFVCSVLSIVIANASAGEAYIAFWNTAIPAPPGIHLPHSLLHWINDALMAAFFFLVGMEIKRELLIGELSSLKKSLLPLFAAIGGMLVPAAIYLLFNKQTIFQHGWGVPMATDIAFSLGIASMLGKKVPASLKTFLMALAIIDDLGAIVIIAFFYGGSIQWLYLLCGIGIAVALFLFPRLKIKFGWWNFALGIVLWYCFFNSGIHATIAGVLFALTIPLSWLEKLEHRLHIPVYFIMLPLFALANTAIIIPPEFIAALNSSLNYGIIGGLFIGKPLGIIAACWLLVKLKWGELPRGISWMQLTGIGILAGIGFTMSIFITMLAFEDTATQDIAKSGVLIASVMAMITGYIWLYFSPGKKSRQ
ncbi:Na+/H+ antiporter NhaA [Agriterribacter humi]|jgi:NhaA family Na+:H+ antiporter|uniref:Na+/H+ antiporter NhaA n=1 Tax=Agriterribacter humi TaxID=1104781 RepID=UPI0012650833|nr:Na+/H+ antiporter NhaA [Agriterribacter humi]